MKALSNNTPADEEAAPYLTQALFLATTMATRPSSSLLIAKRERVFELMSHSKSKHVNVDFAGIPLQFALLGFSDWHESLPKRHRGLETVIVIAQNKLRAAFSVRSAAVGALVEMLREHAPYADQLNTETALRDAAAQRRAIINRARRTI